MNKIYKTTKQAECLVTVTSEHEALIWKLPEETPLALVFNGLTYAIMLCTPNNIEDFVRGFSLTEKIVLDINQIKKIEIEERNQGIEAQIQIDQQRFKALEIAMSRRNLPGRSCGVCGLDSELEFFEAVTSMYSEALLVDKNTIQTALTQFEELQMLRASNKSVHGAGWALLSGEVIELREDVGRHVAVDKLIGALKSNNVDLFSGFMIVSSRCSYDIALKAARSGMRAIISLSAPTAFAHRKALEANITLYTVTKSGVFKISPPHSPSI